MEHWLEGFEDLYMNNAHFRQSADTVVPLILEALAARAEGWDEEREERLRALMEETPMGPGWVPDSSIEDLTPDE